MITALAPLGLTHNISISLSYQDDGTVTATALVALKTKDRDFAGIKPLVFSGPVAEVEAAIAEQLPPAVGRLLEHGNNLAAIDKQIADEKKAKEAEAAKTRAKPTPKPAATPAAKKGKPAAKAKASAAKPAAKPAAAKPAPKGKAAPAPKKPTDPKPTVVKPGLTPAWRQKITAPPAEEPVPDIGTLFGEDPTPPTELTGSAVATST